MDDRSSLWILNGSQERISIKEGVNTSVGTRRDASQRASNAETGAVQSAVEKQKATAENRQCRVASRDETKTRYNKRVEVDTNAASRSKAARPHFQATNYRCTKQQSCRIYAEPTDAEISTRLQ